MPHHEHPYQTNRNTTKVVKVLQLKDSWQNRYEDTTALLEQKLLNYIRLNPRLRESLGSHLRLLWVTGKQICINLNEFSQHYQDKFILPDFQHYCAKFILQFEKLLAEFLREVALPVHFFHFKFSWYEMEFEKLVGIHAAS